MGAERHTASDTRQRLRRGQVHNGAVLRPARPRLRAIWDKSYLFQTDIGKYELLRLEPEHMIVLHAHGGPTRVPLSSAG